MIWYDSCKGKYHQELDSNLFWETGWIGADELWFFMFFYNLCISERFLHYPLVEW